MNTYVATLDPDEGTDNYTVTIQAGPLNIQFIFQWAVATQEQYDGFERYYINLAKNDPLVGLHGEDRNYNYIEYYISIYQWKLENNKTTAQWLAGQQVLPRTVREAQAGYPQEFIIDKRINECISILPLLRQYQDTLLWHFTVSCNGERTTGYVIPGGWYREGFDSFAFRFTSTPESIDKDSLGLVTVEVEVYE